MKIPKIEQGVLVELASRVTPLVRDGKHLVPVLFELTKEHMESTSYPWADKMRMGSPMEQTKMSAVACVRTLHTYGFHGFFKPSIEEVLAQAPEGIGEGRFAFVCDGPNTADDLNREREAMDEGFHVAATTWFRLAD